eukprot:TRINITY_DN2801_c0_g1_i2.p1 TRINITY_DN2801_c0_g1~~TRINITY_DN2801_c0_g1_i2.p1  ORF type:complete len:333 (-),score=68.46 TRINITY_DN2801_c0_g1_i2:41-1039(-)
MGSSISAPPPQEEQTPSSNLFESEALKALRHADKLKEALKLKLLKFYFGVSCMEDLNLDQSLQFHSLVDQYSNPSYCTDLIRTRIDSASTKMKINFAISDVDNWPLDVTIPPLQGALRHLLVLSEYAMIHPALHIGPATIHWTAAGLADISETASASPLMTLEVGELDLADAADQQKMRRALDTIIEWNLTREYSMRADNCLTFVKQLCFAMDLQLPEMIYISPLGIWLDSLRNYGEICKFYEKDGNRVEFETHEELDTFIYNNPEILNDPLDLALLKGFDRSFWMGFMNRKQNGEDVDGDENVDCPAAHGCPFGDPAEKYPYYCWLRIPGS